MSRPFREKRCRDRVGYLREIYRSDPARFGREWNRRIESWAWESGHRARSGLTPTTLAILERAGRELLACGPEAVAEYGEATITAITGETLRALARTYDPRLYRLTWWPVMLAADRAGMIQKEIAS